jgi:hydroxymethylpyrimidine/phosphomethylpyrimidine kinase
MQGAACPRILVIAGTDSSGGAGLTRDTATATALGCHVAPVVTAVTVQTSQALSRISAMPVKMVHAQMAAALEEAPVAAVKIGMLGNAGIARAIAQGLPRDIPVVLDPVLKTSSGGLLGTGQSLAPLMEKVTLLTPNLSESAFLSGQPFSEEPEALRWHAEILMAAGSTRGPEAILIKGGHASGEESRDHLFFADAHAVFAAPRHRLYSCHGHRLLPCQRTEHGGGLRPGQTPRDRLAEAGAGSSGSHARRITYLALIRFGPAASRSACSAVRALSRTNLRIGF